MRWGEEWCLEKRQGREENGSTQLALLDENVLERMVVMVAQLGEHG